MREALAATDHDFTLAGPRKRPRSAARRGSARSAQSKRRLLGVAAVALCVAALGGIVFNALTLQKARHPAPLFGHAARTVPTPETAARPAPVPAPRPFSLAREDDGAKDAAEDAPARPRAASPEPAAPRAAPAAPEARPHDPISELITTGAVRPAAEPAVSRTVLAAQKALVKLGYVLKPDGAMGAATKQAIERYERDHGRASRGELTPTVMRSLSAESGIQIN